MYRNRKTLLRVTKSNLSKVIAIGFDLLDGFHLHLYLQMIDYCGVAPLVELYGDRHVLVWIDYSVMELIRQCFDC